MALQALEAQKAEQRLLWRLRRSLPELAREEGGPEYIADLLAETKRRAPAYELETELDLYRFTMLMATHGPWFDRNGRRPWIQTMLEDTRFDGTTRIDRLLARLEQERDDEPDAPSTPETGDVRR